MQVYFIKNVEDYNPKDLKTEVLLDDWRIVCAWWSLIKQGKKFKYSKNDILRLARKIAEEMRRRGIKFHPETMKEASRELLELVGFEKYATVHRSGKKLGRKITLGEVLDKWEKPIVIKKGFVRVIGGLANHGATEGDIDVLIAWPENTPMEVVHPIVFRLGRALGDLARRMQVNLDRYHGPFTSHVDVYDLVLVPSEQKVVEMSEEEVKFATLRDPQAEKEALQSRKENRIEPLRFFLPLKAVKGYHEGEVYRVEDLLDWFTDRDYPLYVQKKYDGLRIIWMKDGDKVIARTDDGTDVTARFPQLVEQLKHLPVDKVTLDSEVEGWTGEHHWGREEISGYVHEKGKPDDLMCIANVFDVLYVEGLKHHDLPEGDLHEIPYERRYEVLKYLASIGKWLNTSKIPTKLPAFNLTPSYIVTKPSELKEALEKAKNEPYSEGAMIKSSKGLYPLTGVTRGWLKFKTSADIHAVVIERIPTKTEGVYNYRIGLIIPPDWKVPENKTVEITLKNGKKVRVMDVGKTFNSKLKLKQGDIITVLIHTLFYHVTPEGRYVTVYEPKVKEYRPNQIIPDDAETALNVAKAAKILQVKGEMSVTEIKGILDDETRQKFIDAMELSNDMTLIIPFAGSGLLIYDIKKRYPGIRIIANDFASWARVCMKSLLFGREEDISHVKKQYGLEEFPNYAALLAIIKWMFDGKTGDLKKLAEQFAKKYKPIKATKVQIFQMDARDFVKKVKGDVAFVDPPKLTRKKKTLWSQLDELDSQIEKRKIKRNHGDVQKLLDDVIKHLQVDKIYVNTMTGAKPNVEGSKVIKIGRDTLFRLSEPREFVIQHHYRGRSCHIDFRYKVNNHLEGFTIADQEPGMIKEDVTSVEQGKKLDKNPRLWKHEAGTKLLAIPKAPEPVEWLSIEGTVPPGEVGATKYEYGVFTILDKGTLDLGAQKPYFKEFFLHGKKFKGRYVFRQLSNIFREGGKLPPVDLSSITREHLEQLDVNSLRKIIRALRKHLGISKMAAVTKPALINEIMKLVEELQRKGVKRIPEDVLEPLTEKSEFIWLFWKPADQTPYVLSKRAVEKGWVPPYLQSALPREIERKIPKKFKYWLHKDENTRRTIRDQLVQAIHEGEVKLSEPPTIKAKEGEFVLQWHWWKERKLIRAGPSAQHWDLRIKVPGVKGLIHFVLADNPGYTDVVSAYYKECKDEEWMKKGEKGAEYLPPGTEGNPTKATDAWIEVIDKGKVEVLELNPQFGKFNFHGELLNGLYTVESEDGLYVFKKSEVPK